MMVIPGVASPFFGRTGFGDLPVGSVTAFAGTLGLPDSASPPATVSPTAYTSNPLEAWGWMVCDGRSLACVDYPELFAVLGYVYGGADDNFNIPDYRGYFLRGIGTGTRNDPDIGQRSKPPGGQGASDGVGSVQPFAVQTHEHTYNSAPAPSAPSPSGTAAGAPSVTSTPTKGGPVTGAGQAPPVQVSLNETRPLNVYVNYLIKFTYGLVPLLR
ncbi:rhizosphere induced protein RhiB [Acidovorax sp. Root275]|uniref:tail fiber protein n=1 Tax=Acidovorax sp. Root275 TaxID=1736508 RepID=UPI00071071DA|nr:tail fiber protein [Acidovorax sp. Root275]KRD48208.1 rhizosphere induced protein RhiB [Acidovorax sp. Root275]